MNENNVISIKTKGHGGKRANAGRPPRKIPWKLLEKFASAHCTLGEIAAAAEIDLRSLHRACERDKKRPLKEWVDEHRAYGLSQLKKVRFEMAVKQRSWKAVEWLSRQLLHEVSTATVDINQRIEGRVIFTMPLNGREIDMREPKVLEHKDAE